jgi:L-ascorbate metabolism protein UlaG (beta-lactamase superfamily)
MPRIRFFGQAAFRLEEGDTQVLIDPFFEGNPFLSGAPADLKPSNILVTHAHGDHLGDAVPLAKRHGATILSTPEVASYCAKQGAAVEAAHIGGTVKYPWGSVRFVPALHSSSAPDDYSPTLGVPVGFVVRFGGIVFYHAGDTGLFSDMRLIAERDSIDVAYLPIGGHYTMDIDDAVKAAGFLRPRVIIPGHYDTTPLIRCDPGEFKSKVEAATRAKCVILKPGEAYDA